MADAVALPNFDDVRDAAERLYGQVPPTPLLTSAPLDAAAGTRVLIKPETLQRTGSFKFRGAYNALAQLSPVARARGVVTCSSGNHAQGVAAAAALLDAPATIVMPADAPTLKRERTEAYGARIVSYDRATEDREAIAADIATQTGATFVAPYDDPAVISGQGTVGMELIEQAKGLGLVPDVVLVPAGGGGLTAGIALSVKELSPKTQIYTVEPAGFDDHARSFRAGRRERNPAPSGSICDALLAEQPGRLTFAINKSRCAGGLVVSDAEALSAVGYAWRELKLVVEPGGAVALAAVLNRRIETRGRIVAVVLSGGNIDPSTFCRAIAGHRTGGE